MNDMLQNWTKNKIIPKTGNTPRCTLSNLQPRLKSTIEHS